MLSLIVVYTLAFIGFCTVVSLIMLLIMSMWFDINFTVGNREKDGKD